LQTMIVRNGVMRISDQYARSPRQTTRMTSTTSSSFDALSFSDRSSSFTATVLFASKGYYQFTAAGEPHDTRGSAATVIPPGRSNPLRSRGEGDFPVLVSGGEVGPRSPETWVGDHAFLWVGAATGSPHLWYDLPASSASKLRFRKPALRYITLRGMLTPLEAR